ncbi:MAG: hypothetical protein KDE27_01050 [Planctomycetes bacterium]|nr:hypothetical protein [Planctomycetota bacterium]
MLENHYWDTNQNGTFDPSTDYWVMNLAFQPYRQQWVNQVQAARTSTFLFEGIYFDFLDGNLPLGDRNPNNGNAQDGFTALCDEFRLQFNGAGNEFLIATEGQNEHLVRAGGSLGAIHVNDVITVVEDPMRGYELLTNPHPIGAYVLRRHAKAFHAFNVAMPSYRQGGVAMAALAGYAHGSLPTATFATDAINRPWLSDPAAARALTQTIEEGLFRRIFAAELETDPDPAWTDPSVVAIYELTGGAKLTLTEAWVVQKTICDLFWWFGGRAPTATELADLSGRTRCNAIGLYAAMTEVREQFRGTAVVPLTRAQFRAAVQAVFPLYPQI